MSPSPDPTITPATPDDATALAEVHVRSWQAAYAHLLPADWLAALSVERRAATWRRRIAEAPGDTLLARGDGRVLGFVDLGRCRDDGAAPGLGEVNALYAHPSAWGLGIGRRLMDAATTRLHGQGFDAVSLWVLSGNRRGIRFYEAAGFAVVPGSAQVFELGGVPCEEVAMRRDLAP